MAFKAPLGANLAVGHEKGAVYHGDGSGNGERAEAATVGQSHLDVSGGVLRSLGQDVEGQRPGKDERS